MALLSLTPASARAGEAGRCDVPISVGATLRPPWLDAVTAVGAELAERRGCAHVTLEIAPIPAGVQVVAHGEDGARAERIVTRPSSLRAVVLGLVTSIPAEEPPRAEAEPPPTPVPPREAPVAAPPRPPPAPPPIRLDVSAMLGARLGMPTRVLAADAELRADVLIDDWFLMASARFAPIGANLGARLVPGYAYDEIALSLGVGRRWRLGAVTLDIDVAPAIVIMTEEGDVPVDGTGSTADEMRLTTGARLALGRGRLRPAFTVDAEVAPFVARKPLEADAALPPLPTWTLGARGGVVGDFL